MGMAIGSGNDKGPAPTVNVTPLVDVALVVLIIFMMATVAVVHKTFWLNIPKEPAADAAPPPSEATPPLVMTVDASGKIFINKNAIERAELTTKLPRMLAAQKRQILFFDAQDGTPYGTAIEVMDLARAAGARSIAILTAPVASQ